jgi:hypothetical protein
MRTFLIALAFVAAPQLAAAAPAAAAAEPVSFGAAQAMEGTPPAHPERYSFVDVYRLTVAGPMGAQAPAEGAPEVPVRVAAAQAQPAEPRFLVSPVRQPEKWLLALAGLALAGWVAHRRLAHAL